MDDDDDRVDGRGLAPPDERGSDDRLLVGLLLMLAGRAHRDDGESAP